MHDDVPSNLSFDWEFGDGAAVEAALARAAHVTRLRVINNRLVANAIEPRAAIAEWDASTGVTLHTCTQGGWLFTDILAGALKVPPEKVRILTPDVGGGFGMKAFFYPEYAMAAWAARELGRPVKWTGERSETFLADVMGRDHVTEAALALDADHRIIGLKVETTANMGAYNNLFAPFIPTGAALKVLPGVYDVRSMVYRVKGVLTNTTPVDAYRGAGRPELIYLIERLVSAAAREVGLDPAEFRRKNFIGAAAMPFKTTAGEIYDSGEFAKVMDAALEAADWGGIGKRRGEAARRGRRRGIGMAYYIESTMGDPQEAARIEFADGRHGRHRGRHPVQRPGPRDRLRPGPERPPRGPVREDPRGPGRHRQAQMGRRHRRLALADRRGHGDPRRLRHRDRARQALRLAGARDRGRRHRVRARGGRVPGDRHRPQHRRCSSSRRRRAR